MNRSKSMLTLMAKQFLHISKPLDAILATIVKMSDTKNRRDFQKVGRHLGHHFEEDVTKIGRSSKYNLTYLTASRFYGAIHPILCFP